MVAKNEDGHSFYFESLNRNKSAVTLDLGTTEGQDLLLEHVEDADVLVENFTPGTMEKRGLGYERLKSVNEGIIMIRISGFGQTGPKSDRPGYGTIAEEFTGWAHQNRFPDSKSLLPPISLADIVTALFATQSTVVTVYEREFGGGSEVQVVDASLYESLYRLFLGRTEAYGATGRITQSTGNKHHSDSPRGVYETTDGYISISAGSQRTFESMMEAIGRPELVDAERFATLDRRADNSNEMDDIVESWTWSVTTEEAVERITECGGVASAVYDISDIFEDQHYQERRNILEIKDLDLGEVTTTGPVPKLSWTPEGVEQLALYHGEHNEDVFVDKLGLTKEQYRTCQTNGVINTEES